MLYTITMTKKWKDILICPKKKLEQKIEVLEDEKQYFHNNWKNKISQFEKRIEELNYGLTHNEELVRLDSEMKVVVKDQLSVLDDLRKELEQNSEKE